MMDSTHGASNPFAGVPESVSLSQTTYFDADAPPEAEGEESAYVSFTVRARKTSPAFLRVHPAGRLPSWPLRTRLATPRSPCLHTSPSVAGV